QITPRGLNFAPVGYPPIHFKIVTPFFSGNVSSQPMLAGRFQEHPEGYSPQATSQFGYCLLPI
ncbi:MAG TPA: hypothetical protein VK775_20535, partial [Chthoniobacterales bacterium]|nr:hypothetical protein [Chthoniobacterales bacterium]